MAPLPPFRRGRPIGFTDASGRVYLDPDFTRDFFEPLVRSADEGAEINSGVGYVYTIAPRAVAFSPASLASVAQRQSGPHSATTATRQPDTHKATTARRAASCAGYSIARRA